MSTSSETKTVLLQPENQNKKYEALFYEIDSGQIKLPMFQREFVWDKEQFAKLIDSILKGFPIGTFIFWKTKDELRSYKEIGNHKLPETPKGDYAQYILDGQQRITSLYAIRKGLRITKDGKPVDYRDIFIDLDYDPEANERIVVTEKEGERKYISVHLVLNSQLTDLMEEFPGKETLKLIEAYKGKLTSYDFSTITIKDYPIETACEVFARINTGGKELTVFEIMVAKTYDEAKGFDLAEQYEILRDGSDDEKNCLTASKFETLPPAIIMQCVTAIALQDVRSKTILKIPREDFISHWEPMKSSLFEAIDFLRARGIVVSQLLPYRSLMIPLTYFFHKTGNKKPTNAQTQYLEQFFYWVGVTERYSATTEYKIGEDLHKMEAIIKGEQPIYPERELSVSAEVIASTWFSASRAYCKAILCLLAHQTPKSFDNNSTVLLDNSNLKIASSRNYHHFFPKKHIENANKQQGTSWEPNLIANITLIDGYSNKHLIGKKPPSDYIGKFVQSNSKLDDTLNTHLIADKEAFGVLTDDYVLFIQRRAEAIAAGLNEKLMTPMP